MEIGSFIELDLRDSGEYYTGNVNIARLNAARAGIYHACKLFNCSSVYIPYYLCPTVKKFLLKKGIKIKYYFISETFEPVYFKQENDSAVVVVNYFGILTNSLLKKIAMRLKNVIIDNCPAFYNTPIDGCFNVYSPRKFFGVPDGCYVIGENADKNTNEYEQDFSSVTSLFLLKRVEFGSSKSYQDRMKNEKRIDNSDILRMSYLTRALLNNIDYLNIKVKRVKNFQIAHALFKSLNLIDPTRLMDDACVPMVYPLVVEKNNIIDKLNNKQIYAGRWWKHVLTEVPDTSFEAWLSKYMIPIPIDQRYNEEVIKYVHDAVVDLE